MRSQRETVDEDTGVYASNVHRPRYLCSAWLCCQARGFTSEATIRCGIVPTARTLIEVSIFTCRRIMC